ncbi:hypothetical protein WJX72_011958 [[Myrmecia] bisecta]|uniref:Uncharacterized protein n=1 Tax=[Myrmecia] bisecta TaxID=41462 RepID=A0AAW1PME3_9CHLO
MAESPAVVDFKPEKLTPETYAHRRNKTTQQELQSLMHSTEFRAWAAASKFNKKHAARASGPSKRWLLIALPCLAVLGAAGALYGHQDLSATTFHDLKPANSKAPDVATGLHKKHLEATPNEQQAATSSATPSGARNPAPATVMLRQQLELSTSQLHRAHEIALTHRRLADELQKLKVDKATEIAQLAMQVRDAKQLAGKHSVENAALVAQLREAHDKLRVQEGLAAKNAAKAATQLAALSAPPATPPAGVLTPVGRETPLEKELQPAAVMSATGLAATLLLLALTSAFIFRRAAKYYAARLPPVPEQAQQQASSADAQRVEQLQFTITQLSEELASTRQQQQASAAQSEELEVVNDLLWQLKQEAKEMTAELELKQQQLAEAKACFDELHEMHAKTRAEKDAVLARQAELEGRLEQIQQEMSRMVAEQLTRADEAADVREVLAERSLANSKGSRPGKVPRNKENSDANAGMRQPVPRQKSGDPSERDEAELRLALREANDHIRNNRTRQAALQADLTAAKANLDALSAESATREFMLTEAAILEGNLRAQVADLLRANARANDVIADLEAKRAQQETLVHALSADNAALGRTSQQVAEEKAELHAAVQKLRAEKSELEAAGRELAADKAELQAAAQQLQAENAELEAAAGKAALDKAALEATLRHLQDQLNSVTQEVEPAERAEHTDTIIKLQLEAKRAHDKISELVVDKHLLEGRLQDAKQDIAVLDVAKAEEVEEQRQLAQQAASLARYQVECAVIDQQLLQERVLDLEDAAAELQQSREGLHLQVEALQQERQLSQATLPAALQEVRHLTALNTTLEEELCMLDEELAALTAENSQLQGRLLEVQVGIRPRQLADVDVELDRKEHQVAELHLLQTQLEGQLDKLARQLAATEAHNAELATQREKLAQDLANVNEVKRHLETVIQEKADEMSRLASENYNLDAQLEQVTASLGELAASKAECEAKLRQYEQDVNDLSKMYEVADSAKQGMGVELRNLRDALGGLAQDLEEGEGLHDEHVRQGCPLAPFAHDKGNAGQRASDSETPQTSPATSGLPSPDVANQDCTSDLAADGDAMRGGESSAVRGLFAKIGRVARHLGGSEDSTPSAPAPSPAGPHVPHTVINDPRMRSFLENASQRIGALQAAMQTEADPPPSPLALKPALASASPALPDLQQPATPIAAKAAESGLMGHMSQASPAMAASGPLRAVMRASHEIEQKYAQLQQQVDRSMLRPGGEDQVDEEALRQIQAMLRDLTEAYRRVVAEQSGLAMAVRIQDDLEAELHAARCRLEEASVRSNGLAEERQELEQEQLTCQELVEQANEEVQIAMQRKVSTEADLKAFEEVWGFGQDVSLHEDAVAAQDNLEAHAKAKAAALEAVELVLASKAALLLDLEATYAVMAAQEQHIDSLTAALTDAEAQLASQTNAEAQVEKAFEVASVALTVQLDALGGQQAAQQARHAGQQEQQADASADAAQEGAGADADSSPAKGLINIHLAGSLPQEDPVTPVADRSITLLDLGYYTSERGGGMMGGGDDPARTPTMKQRPSAAGAENVAAAANSAARIPSSPDGKLKRSTPTQGSTPRPPLGAFPLNVHASTSPSTGACFNTPASTIMIAGLEAAPPAISPQSPLEKALSLLDEGWFSSPR